MTELVNRNVRRQAGSKKCTDETLDERNLKGDMLKPNTSNRRVHLNLFHHLFRWSTLGNGEFTCRTHRNLGWVISRRWHPRASPAWQGIYQVLYWAEQTLNRHTGWDPHIPLAKNFVDLGELHQLAHISSGIADPMLYIGRRRSMKQLACMPMHF